MPTHQPTETPAASSTTPSTPAPAQDPNAALAALVQQAVATLDTIAAGLGTDPALTPKDKLRAAKFRKGGGPIVSTIGDLAQQQQLESPALPVATMESLLERASTLAPLTNRLASFVALVNDIVFVAQSEAWSTALTYYALLQRRAKCDSKLATALAPVTDFLAYRHPSTKTAPGQPTRRQTRAARKAQKALATIAGGKLASTNLLEGGEQKPGEEAASSLSSPQT